MTAPTPTTPLTFGKYSGYTPFELAAAGDTGRGYLRWGVEKLRSPAWRAAFEQALAADVAYDMPAEARLVAKIEGVSADEVLREMETQAQEDAARDAAWAAYEAELDRVAGEFAPRLDVTAQKASVLARRFGLEGQPYARSQFSSAEKFRAFEEFMAALDAVPTPKMF